MTEETSARGKEDDQGLFDTTPVPTPVWRLARVEEDDELEVVKPSLVYIYQDSDFG